MSPTHDPASAPSAASPEPPRALHGAPWLAPSTSSAAVVVTRVRLPTVAECAELLAAGWTPLLGRLGVWADDSGDGQARWWTGALERARKDRAAMIRGVPRMSQIVSLAAESVSQMSMGAMGATGEGGR